MINAAFFDAVRKLPFNGKLRPEQVSGCEVLIDAMQRARWPLAHAAYGLATAYHETAHTMQPIAEYGRGKGRAYGVPDPKTGLTYYGRGYVQLTWLANYLRAGHELGHPLSAQPDLALRPDIAADIMVRGMEDGWFTGKANRTYLDAVPPNYVGARRIINGTDKADLIAGYARAFEFALRAAGYAPAPARDAAYRDGVAEIERPRQQDESDAGIPASERNQAVSNRIDARPAAAAPLPPPPDIEPPPPPDPPSRVGWWSMLAGAVAAILKQRR